MYLPQLFTNTTAEVRTLVQPKAEELASLEKLSQGRFFETASADEQIDPLISQSVANMKAYIDTHLAAQSSPENKLPANNLKEKLQEHLNGTEFQMLYSSEIPSDYSGPVALVLADEHGSGDLYDQHMDLLSKLQDDESLNLRDGLFEYSTATNGEGNNYQDYQDKRIFKGLAFSQLRNEQGKNSIKFSPADSLEGALNHLINSYAATSMLFALAHAQAQVTNDPKDHEAVQRLNKEGINQICMIAETIMAIPEKAQECMNLYKFLLARYLQDLDKKGIEKGIHILNAVTKLANGEQIDLQVLALNTKKEYLTQDSNLDEQGKKALSLTREREAFIDISRELHYAQEFEKFNTGLRPVFIGASHAESLTSILAAKGIPTLVLSTDHVNRVMTKEYKVRDEYFAAKRAIFDKVNP